MAEDVSRRATLRTAAPGGLAMAPGVGRARAEETRQGVPPPVPYELAPSPYACDALEPVLSEEILRVHHDRHHAGYVNGLNSTPEKLEAAGAAGDYSEIKALSRDLAFHGSGHVLHTRYWTSMTPGGPGGPEGEPADARERSFGSVEACKAQFAAASKAVEGSGWGVLALEPTAGGPVIPQAENHQNPAIWGVVPLLVCDVWEHACHLQYQNRRSDYVDAFMKIVDW